MTTIQKYEAEYVRRVSGCRLIYIPFKSNFMNELKPAKEWQKELAGETSIESIRQIQRNAMEYAAEIILNQALPENPTISRDEYARQAILDEVEKLK